MQMMVSCQTAPKGTDMSGSVCPRGNLIGSLIRDFCSFLQLTDVAFTYHQLDCSIKKISTLK